MSLTARFARDNTNTLIMMYGFSSCGDLSLSKMTDGSLREKTLSTMKSGNGFDGIGTNPYVYH